MQAEDMDLEKSCGSSFRKSQTFRVLSKALCDLKTKVG
jgi:hypothetical protein